MAQGSSVAVGGGKVGEASKVGTGDEVGAGVTLPAA